MRIKVNLWVLTLTLTIFAFANDTSAKVCFVVGGCGNGNNVAKTSNCENLGYSETNATCASKYGNKKIAGGASCKGKYQKCVCNPLYYKYNTNNSDPAKYDLIEQCDLENMYAQRQCKADIFVYPRSSEMDNEITQGTNICDDMADDYKCPAGMKKPEEVSNIAGYKSITAGLRNKGYPVEATCFLPKTCDYDLGYQDEECDKSQTEEDQISIASRETTKICHKCRAKTCQEKGGDTLAKCKDIIRGQVGSYCHKIDDYCYEAKTGGICPTNW